MGSVEKHLERLIEEFLMPHLKEQGIVLKLGDAVIITIPSKVEREVSSGKIWLQFYRKEGELPLLYQKDLIMKKVCLLLRCSTSAQDYEYQRSTLTSLCKKNGWEIISTFENKVSGAKKNEERQEIVELLDFVKHNEVDAVVATEVSRLGRNTMEALKIIESLNENKVNLYFANYNIETLLPDGSVNPIAHLLLTICIEISSYERNLIRYRMKVGYEDYLKRRKENPTLRLGRQGYKKDEQTYRDDYAQELSLLGKGISLRNVQKITGTSLGTLQKIKQYL